MAKVKIYTWGFCPYCIRAKNLLNNKNIDFEEISLDGKNKELEALIQQTGMKTVPQIFINDKLIGGFRELSILENHGELDKMINSEA